MDFLTIEITSKKVCGNNVDFSTIKITFKKVRGNKVDFSTIEITLTKERGNNVDFSTIEITSKKTHGNNVHFSTIEITLKKARGNQADFSISEVTSKEYAEMTWKFVNIWSSTYRRNIHVESTWIRHGVLVGIQEDHGVARANAEQGNRYIDTSDDEEISDDSISIPGQDHLDTQVAKLLAVRNSPDKIDLVGKISTEAQAPADAFPDQLSKDLAEDEKQGPNISPHLAVIVNNLWQQNIFGDKFKDRLSKYAMPKNLCSTMQ